VEVSDRIYFSNFYDIAMHYGIGTLIRGDVHGDSIIVPEQTVTNGYVTFTVSALGCRASTGVITFSISLTDPAGGFDSCSSTYTPI
jgi:hypothetical protein